MIHRFRRILSAFVVALSISPLLQAAEALTVQLSTTLDARMHRNALFAVDGDDATYFASERPARPDDAFTITLQTPAQLEKIAVMTGRPDDSDQLTEGVLEVSEDGQTFTEVARIKAGAAESAGPERPVKSVRLRVLGAADKRLMIREFRLAEKALAPVGRVTTERKLGAEAGEATIRFLGDATLLQGDEQTRLTAFLGKAAQIYLDQLPEMVRRLNTPWEKVPKTLLVVYKAETGNGVPAYASGSTITLNTAWVLRDPADSVGMFIHELSHVVQAYRPGNPSWIVEGLSDLIRLEMSPPEDAWVQRTKRIDPAKSDYRRGYGEAAKFLAWLQQQYAPELGKKLSRALFDRTFTDAFWEQTTGKPLDTLWAEYQAT